jgi:CheY-like chemotaxis protein
MEVAAFRLLSIERFAVNLMTSQTIVLVVEDDPILRQIYRQSLERRNYLIHEASNGEEALEKLKEISPQVIILDMMMPGMGGPTMLQKIRQNPELAKIRIVVITAYPQFRESALHYEVDQFLTKPLRPADIVKAIETALDSA